MVSGLTLKTLAWVSCLPLSITLIFALTLKLGGITHLNFSQLSSFQGHTWLVSEYVPPQTGTGKPPAGEGSGSRT